MARGWGTGGLQVTLTLVNPSSVVKVIDQGADDGVNAASIRRFIEPRLARHRDHQDTLDATIVQSHHRVPEETMGDEPDPRAAGAAIPSRCAGSSPTSRSPGKMHCRCRLRQA